MVNATYTEDLSYLEIFLTKDDLILLLTKDIEFKIDIEGKEVLVLIG